MVSQEELKAQLKEIMAIPENMHCIDCGDKRPTWASLIVPPPDAAFTDPLGCFCCYHCSGAHRRMGTHICFVRSTNLDEWKEKEVDSMRKGGNVMINKVFEAKLTEIQKSVVKPDRHTELDPRSDFIYDKYQHRKWYDDKLAQLKSTFESPAAASFLGGDSQGNEKRASAGEFDDFFAARSQIAASDDWHDSKEGNNDFNSDLHDEFSAMASNSISAISAFQMAKDGPQSPDASKYAQQSARGGLSYTRTPKGNTTDGKSTRPLGRGASRQAMLDNIRTFVMDQENQNVLPQDVIRRGRTNRSSKDKLDRRRGNSGDSDSKARRANSNESDGGRRQKALERTPSMDSDEGPQKPRSRRVRRTPSDESKDLNPSEHTGSSSSRPNRKEPTRGVARTKSMDDTIGSPLSAARKQRTRSRSVKRGVRRTTSSDNSTIDGSADLSNRSTTKKPPRRPRSNLTDEQKQSETKQMNESLSSRRSRHADDSSTRRRRSPQRATGGDREDSSTTGKSDTSSSRARSSSNRRRNKSQPRKPAGNAINVRRVATVRDRSPRRNFEPSEKSPVSRNRTLEVNLK